ncbi:hypothetical protein SEA_DATBOI_124 [Gordonia phage DatBoi]|nr:hypothetical protein SEA_DATBOI_124 [Gordonia phage DatBoi]
MADRAITYPMASKALMSALLTRMDGEYSVETVTDELGVVDTYIDGRVDLSSLAMHFVDELERLMWEREWERHAGRMREIEDLVRNLSKDAAIPPQYYPGPHA